MALNDAALIAVVNIVFYFGVLFPSIGVARWRWRLRTKRVHPFDENFPCHKRPEDDKFYAELRYLCPLPLKKKPTASYPEVVQPKSERVTAADIRQGQQLLRTLYALNVKVASVDSGFSTAVEEEAADRRRREAGALAELRRTTAKWRASAKEWTPQEWQMVVELDDLAQSLDITGESRREANLQDKQPRGRPWWSRLGARWFEFKPPRTAKDPEQGVIEDGPTVSKRAPRVELAFLQERRARERQAAATGPASKSRNS